MRHISEGKVKMDSHSSTNLHALVIGIDQYKMPLKTLKNAVNDGKAIYEVLSEQYGFAVKFLPNASADKANILTSIEYFLKLGPEASWVFYFAGHGTVEGEQGYLLPSDAEKGVLKSFIGIQELLQSCNQSDLDQILIILDSCYSGRGFVRTESLDNPAPSPDEKRIRQIITAGNPHERVLDGGADTHSLFTGTLLEILSGWTGTHDKYNQITFPKLRDELAYQIPTKLRAMGYSAISQQPLGGNFLSNISMR
ncbi:MAG TPA: caspase family protein, partial [Anaerolineales bacterium]|nr:caspase family protein [Anaerolineales bacterium]